MLRASGYRGACTTVIGRSGAVDDPYALPRIPMENGDGPFRVRCKLAGAYDWVGGVKSFCQRLLTRPDRIDAGLPAGSGCETGMSILVTDASGNHALAVVRSLGRRGLRIIAADGRRCGQAGFSRFCAARA